MAIRSIADLATVGTRAAESTAATGSTTAKATTAPGTTTAAGTNIARPTWATRTTRTTPITPIAWWATTITTRATTATATFAAAGIAWRRGELPADPGTWHLATTDALVFFRLVFRGTVHEAPETPRLVSTIAAWPTATTTTAAAATAATATIATSTAVASASTIVALRPALAADAIDHVVKLAARHRAVRSLLALIHAHEPHLIDRVADDVECLEQTRRAIRLYGQRFGHGNDRRIVGFRRLARRCRGLGLGRRVVGCCGVATAFARFGSLAFGCRTGFAIGRRGLGGLRGGLCGLVCRVLARRLGQLPGRGRPPAAGCGACDRCLSQDQRGELGERLHGG